MNATTYKFTQLIISGAGLILSSYITIIKFATNTCVFNEPCPTVFGIPACYFGFSFFLALFFLAIISFSTSRSLKRMAVYQIVVSGLSFIFALYFTIPLLGSFKEGITFYTLGLPSCVYGMLFSGVVLLIAIKWCLKKNLVGGKLIIVRHHESDWNKQRLWTGMRDRHLTEYGFKKSEELGKIIKDIKIDRAYASMQVRSIETLSSMIEVLGLFNLPTEHVKALNERDYGDYTGKNKWQMEQLLGKDVWEQVRREWDYHVPHGETLKMVYDRVVPFYTDTILPHLKNNENILIVSHGNAIRALMKYIEQIPDEKVKDIEMLFGAVVIYEVDAKGKMTYKEVRKVPSEVHA